MEENRTNVAEGDSSSSSADKKDTSGIIYMSRVPPQMTPHQVRSLLSRFGTINRIYLSAESATKTTKLKRKACFEEGWIEFTSWRTAKQVVEMLNGTPMGGKKINRFHDDLWCLKFLGKEFKWHNLTEKFTYKNAVRGQKLRMEMEMDRKEGAAYLRNVEKAKIVEKKRKKITETDGKEEARAPIYKQRRVISEE